MNAGTLSTPRDSLRSPSGRRVAITGIGLVTPAGGDRAATWQALLRGTRCGRLLSADDWDKVDRPLVAGLRIPPSGCPACGATVRSDQEPALQMALTCADEAWQDARAAASGSPPERRGCVFGTSKGGMRALARWAQRSSTGCCADDAGVRSSDDPPAAALWSAWPHTPSTAIAGRFDLRGPALAPVAACATGVVCVNRGAELVRDGTCDVVLAGSSDASLVPAVLASFDRLQILARRPDDPAGACRPFDRDRNGFLIGEGAAALVLEDWDLAAGRGVPIYAEWVGGRQLSDPTGLTALAPDAAPLTRLLQDLLSGAGLTPRDVHYINLHGTGTRTNDRCESLALRRLCGGDAPPWLCGSLKGNLGHLLGAAGSVELAATALALREGVVPPHVNLEHPDPACQPGLLPLTATRRQLRHAVKLSLGFGGHLAATLLRAPQ